MGFGNTSTSPSPPPTKVFLAGWAVPKSIVYYGILPQVLDMLLYVLVIQKYYICIHKMSLAN